MQKIDLNELPQLLKCGKLTEKQVIDEICCFVAKNYPVYGLQKYDEDFRQDIIVHLIEKGPYLLHLFNPQLGDFFTFLYCHICTFINSKIKTCVMNSMRERINYEEGIYQLREKEIKYHKIDYNNFEKPKIPYAQNKIPAEELQRAFKELSLKHNEKKVIILALKSSYYLTDEQIQKICDMYRIKPEYFYSMIQHCKNTLTVKSEKREKMQQRRNFAYYHHKRYRRIIYELTEDNIPENKNMIKQQYYNKEQKHLHNWNRLNQAFEKGHLHLRPTNKTVANLMGICERQVNYYVNCAKKDLKKKVAEKNKEA